MPTTWHRYTFGLNRLSQLYLCLSVFTLSVMLQSTHKVKVCLTLLRERLLGVCHELADRSRGLSVGEVEQSPELPASNGWSQTGRRRCSPEKPVVTLLMVPFAMIMLDVLGDEPSEMALTQGDHSVEALVFDRPDEPLGIGVKIRTSRRQSDRPAPFPHAQHALIRRFDNTALHSFQIFHTFSGSRFNRPASRRDWIVTSRWVWARLRRHGM